MIRRGKLLSSHSPYSTMTTTMTMIMSCQKKEQLWSYIHYQQDGKQATVIQPFFLFVDEDYNDYDSTRQAVVPLFSLFNDDDDDYNDYEKQNQSWSDDKTRTIMKCNNDVYYGKIHPLLWWWWWWWLSTVHPTTHPCSMMTRRPSTSVDAAAAAATA